MKKRTTAIIILVLCIGLALTGCTKNVTDLDITLSLSYGERSGKYTGVLKDDLPNGQGKFTTQNDAGDSWTYEGNFVDGHFSGEGKTTWPESGLIEEGTYSNDELNGYGKYFVNNTIKYDGNWKNGEADGEGKLYFSDGERYYSGLFTNGIPEENDFKSKCTAMAYTDLARQPDSYVMAPVKVIGEVIQVMEGENGSVQYRLAENDDYSNVYFLSYIHKDGENRILENDIIEVYGLYQGLTTYESVMGGNITVPSIAVQYVTINNN